MSKEWIPDRVMQPGKGRYAVDGCLESLSIDLFDSRTLRVLRPGQVGMQDFFSVGRKRLGVLYAVLGAKEGSEKAITEANEVIASLKFATVPEAEDYADVRKRKR